MRVLSALTALWLAGCASTPAAKTAPPELMNQELEIGEQSINGFVLRLKGSLQSQAPAKVTRAHYEVVVDGAVTKKGELPLELTLEPGKPAPVMIEQSGQYAASGEALKALTEKNALVLTALRGTLEVDVGGKSTLVPFARSKEVRLPRLPTVKLHELDAARYSKEEVNAVVYLGIVNPNHFPLSVGKLDYVIQVAGKEMTKGTVGKGEQVSPGATGVFEVQLPISQETYGPTVTKLIASRQLPVTIDGELAGEQFTVPYQLNGNIKLTR